MNLEPTAMVKNTIIEKQEALIDLLYQEDTASDEMKALITPAIIHPQTTADPVLPE